MSAFPSRITAIGIAVVALLFGVALGSRFHSSSAGPPSPAPADAADRIAELTRKLDRERELRGALELELSLLRQEIEPDPGTDSPTAPTAAATRVEDTVTAAKQTSENAETPGEKTTRDEWFDASRLTDLGMDERHAEWLHERFESLQMEELYLRDQATRERWVNKPRYAQELRALRDETRAAIGDEDYDAMLYASGRHNRVLLSDVLQNSPAASAGIEAGDVLLRYDDRPIYDVRDLLAETASGEFGETASIDVERNGERLRLYVARGPLGARIQSLRRAPSVEP